MKLTEITHSTIPWNLLFLCLEDIDSLKINKHRKNALKKAVGARPESKIAQIIDSWFPEGQERLLIPLQATDNGEDPERRHQMDKLTTQIAAAFETYGFIASPQFLNQNLVYDEENHRAVKFAQAIDLIKSGRKPHEGHTKVSWASTSNPEEATRFLTRLAKEYMDEKSYDNSAKVGGGEKCVIISRNQTDIATISTGRPWTSCMDLKDGVNASHVARAMKDGMIVAYLVLGNQEQLTTLVNDTSQPIDALARIVIKPMRRYMSKVDITNNVPVGFGWPEGRIYHANRADVTGFRETVTDWTRSKVLELMGNNVTGKYRVKGGWTDTLANFDVQEVFYDDANISNQLADLLNRPYVGWHELKPIVTAIHNQPRAKISDTIRDQAFQLLIKAQPKDKLANRYTIDKSIRTHMEPAEEMVVKMLRKFPEVIPTVRNYVSPLVRDWLLGHTNQSVVRYLNNLLTVTEKAITLEPTDYMTSFNDKIRSTFNNPKHDDLAPNTNDRTQVDVQTVMRLLSRIKVVIRTFMKEQNILLPNGTINRILNVLQLAEAIGIKPEQTQGIKELLPEWNSLSHNTPASTS